MPDPEPTIDPLWTPELYEPLRDHDGDLIVVPAAKYFAVSEFIHPHPQGWPCHANCLLGSANG